MPLKQFVDVIGSAVFYIFKPYCLLDNTDFDVSEH